MQQQKGINNQTISQKFRQISHKSMKLNTNLLYIHFIRLHINGALLQVYVIIWEVEISKVQYNIKQLSEMQVAPNEQRLKDKSKQILRFAKQNKVAKLASGSDQNSLIPFTMILQPYRVSPQQFQNMKKMSYLWQKITHLASMDSQMIIKVFGNVANDPMVSPMIQIYKQILKRNQQIGKKNSGDTSLAKNIFSKPKMQFFRTDFFVTQDKQNNLKLIQYNNMSVSMAGISQQFQQCQKSLWGSQKNIIQNKCTETYAQGFINFYKRSKLNGIMLVVVQSKQTNIVDQSLLFQAIKNGSNIEIHKVVLQELNKFTHLDQNNNLYYKNDKKVSIVYYRAGYSSRQKIQWSGIKKCNLSNAINIPEISAFLVGTKKMQAQLSKKQIMKRYLTQEQSQLLMKSVIDTWEFSQNNSKKSILQMIQKEGVQKFVLKPNQQGGKNNFFGEDAFNKIKQLSEQQLNNYILTRRIYARRQNCTLIRSKQWDKPEISCCQIQSQVSIYGCVCSDCQSCIKNKCKCGCLQNCCGGFLVRCKPQGVNEAGLMAGTGALGGLEVKNQQ